MSICSNIKDLSQRHGWLSDFFSVLAVVLLFASVGLALHFERAIMSWLSANWVLHVPLLVGALALDVLVIFGLLCAGTGRCDEGACFRTFRGRRHGGPSIGSAFSNWIRHMEHVGKKHR